MLLQSTTQTVSGLVAELGGLAILAATLAAIGAVVHRWYVREPVPHALALLLGLSGVAIYLNTTTALGTVIAGDTKPTETQVALFNIVAFLVGTGGATVGRYVGDRFGTDVILGEGLTEVEDDVGRLVQSVGRVVAVELPADIDDVVGYDPLPDETKEELAGKRFLFPRRLTVGELRERLTRRLKADYGVGHVDVELAADGSVEYLALGSRAAGIGPTLPPATNAVAIRADPAFAASAGDLVQVWETDPMRRVLTAELRGVSEDTVTIAIDAADTQKVDPTTEYRLVTLPVEDRPDREFASLLRAADETFSSVTVEAGSPLHGLPVGALDLSVVALKPESDDPRTLPTPSTVLAPGDVLFAIARPEALRRLRTAAKPLDPSLVSGPGRRRREPTTSDDAAATRSDTAGASTDQGPATEESAVDESSTAAGDGTPDENRTDATASDDTPSEEASASDPAEETPESEDGVVSGKAGSSSFQDLKEDFESGDAEWAEEDADEANSDTEVAFEDEDDGGVDPEADDESDHEELDGPDIGEEQSGESSDEESGDGDDGLGFDDDEDDGLEDLSFDDEGEGDDDLSSLSFDEEDDEGLSLDEDNSEDSDDEDAADDGDDDDGDGDDDDDDDDDGGASSFQQLKEEFESGDADWEDDISDSPGGDMRLDE